LVGDIEIFKQKLSKSEASCAIERIKANFCGKEKKFVYFRILTYKSFEKIIQIRKVLEK
jgi:hypothetical protein